MSRSTLLWVPSYESFSKCHHLPGQMAHLTLLASKKDFNLLLRREKGFAGGSVEKNSLANAGHRRHRFNLWVRKIPWGRRWQLTPVFLPGKSHGQRSLVGYSSWGCKVSDTTEHVPECMHACTHVHIHTHTRKKALSGFIAPYTLIGHFALIILLFPMNVEFWPWLL